MGKYQKPRIIKLRLNKIQNIQIMNKNFFIIVIISLFYSCASKKLIDNNCKEHKVYLKSKKQGPFDINSKYCVYERRVGSSKNCKIKFNIYNRLNGDIVNEGFVSIDSIDYHFDLVTFEIEIPDNNYRIGIASFDIIANKFIIESLNLENLDYIEINCYVGAIIQI